MNKEELEALKGKKVRVNNKEVDHADFIGREGVIKIAEQKEDNVLCLVKFVDNLSIKGFRSENMTIGELYFDLNEKTLDFI